MDPGEKQELVKRVKAVRARYRMAGRRDSKDRKSWLPEVDVFARAVELAVKQDLFFKKDHVQQAMKLLDDANARMDLVQQGKRGLELLGWDGKPSPDPILLVGGFRSKIDDSVQPYGLVIPAEFSLETKPCRLDVWLHGRGDNRTEIPFLWERKTRVGTYSPKDTIVLHPFGRHCNAFKFAGEVDVYESIAHVSKFVSVDRERIAMRGFSMGGAGVWHLAVHDPLRWFAVNPGAGFVDTIEYQKWQDQSPYPIGDVRKKLMQWYDVLPWSSNLQNTHVLAYSGERDKQRQAAQRVTAALKEKDIPFQHIIGAKMGHKIAPDSKKEIDRLLEQYSRKPVAREPIDFTTFFLRYHRAGRLSVTGLEEQFTEGRAKVDWITDRSANITSNRITHMDIRAETDEPVDLLIDGDSVTAAPWKQGNRYVLSLVREQIWRVAKDTGLRKRPGMQGPIDDAFCSRFVFVIPSRPAANGVAQRFIDREMKFAAKRWRQIMRGNVRFVKDVEVTDQQIKNSNLICFGDFTSNRYLAKIAPRLPMQWTKKDIQVDDQTYDATTRVLAFCYPNPDNPSRYVVANSGMTFREFSNVSNSRQIAMLPDWVVFDATSKEDGIFAGEIQAQGFFNEHWQFQAR